MKLQISNCKKAAVQDGMIGLFFEDINYAADGGLYAEMIEKPVVFLCGLLRGCGRLLY